MERMTCSRRPLRPFCVALSQVWQVPTDRSPCGGAAGQAQGHQVPQGRAGRATAARGAWCCASGGNVVGKGGRRRCLWRRQGGFVGGSWAQHVGSVPCTPNGTFRPEPQVDTTQDGLQNLSERFGVKALPHFKAFQGGKDTGDNVIGYKPGPLQEAVSKLSRA